MPAIERNEWLRRQGEWAAQQLRKDLEEAKPMSPDEYENFQDITGDGETIVEFEIRADSEVVWLNVNGVTRTRICRITELHITDNRKGKK